MNLMDWLRNFKLPLASVSTAPGSQTADRANERDAVSDATDTADAAVAVSAAPTETETEKATMGQAASAQGEHGVVASTSPASQPATSVEADSATNVADTPVIAEADQGGETGAASSTSSTCSPSSPSTTTTPATVNGSVNAAASPPDTSALNQKIVQAVDFSNAQTTQYLSPAMIRTPPDVMATQSAGLAVQDAAGYMNAIMQIALAAQAVIAKKAAEGPVQAVEEIPVLLEMQKMVASAVEVYGQVSQVAGNSAKAIGTAVSSITSG